ncbi:MAG TPA: VOC family protein [Terriglobia bacterium]|nr:VOC family protein [Terriglobia bacterium]
MSKFQRAVIDRPYKQAGTQEKQYGEAYTAGMKFITLAKALAATSLALPLLLSAQRAPTSPMPPTPVVQLQNLAHAVDSLDKTVPFYRDVLGLALSGRDPLAQKPQALDEDLSKFTGTTGASFRAATFRIPNASFGFELTEFTGTTRKAAQPRLQDPGAATLVLQVRDMDKMFARLKAAHTTIVTAGGEPLNPSGNAASKMRELLIRDPDGFFVELQQPDPLPAAAASGAGDIIGGAVQLSIEDSATTVAFLRAAIGFNARPTGQLATNATVAKLINLEGAKWRITHGNIPGTMLDFGLIEYNGVPREKFLMGAQDPGAPAFTMVVRDIDAAVDQWTKAGGAVLSTGGKAIKRANGAGNVFVRDVNGFTWELIQRAPQ